MNIPIVVLCQVKRESAERGSNKRPELSDLRESGAIEQDADVVMMLYRADYYNQDEPKKKSNGEPTKYDREREVVANMPKDKNVSYLEVLVKKNRNGQTGSAPLLFYKDVGRFDEPSQEFIDTMLKTIGE